MSGGGSSSADPSIDVVEVRTDGVTGDPSSSGWQESRKSDGNSFTSGAGRDDGNTDDVVERWRDGESNVESGQEEGGVCGNDDEDGDDVDDMAERVLQTLQRKDALLEEQARTLEHRQMEVAKLQRDLDELQEEKQRLTQQLRGFLGHAGHTTTTVETANEGRSVNSSILLLHADSQLQDERAERKQDAEYFRAHIDQLTAQLAQAQRDASAREARHAQDLEDIQREMRELSTVVDDLHSTKSALRRTQEELAKATEAKVQCQLERDHLVRSLQEALRCEKLERHRQLDFVRAEAQEWQRAAAAAEAKCRDVEAAHGRAAEETRTLRLETQQVVAEHAALVLQMEAAEQQLWHVREQRAAERAAAAEAHQQLETQLEAALKDIEQLRSVQDAQSQLLAEENKRHASFQEEVAGCVHGTQQLEEALVRCERQFREAEKREKLTADERDQLRTQLQRLAVTSRRELLEQQQLAEEIRRFHQAKIQQLQQAVECQRQRAGQLEESSRTAQSECAALRASLDRALRQFDESTAELRRLRQQRATFETMLTEAQQAHGGCDARERQMAGEIDALRGRLQLRERARRELRARVQRLEEREQRRHLAEATNSLIRVCDRERHAKKGARSQVGCQNGKNEEMKTEGGPLRTVGTEVSTTSSAKTLSSNVTKPPPQRDSPFDMWQARVRTLEARNATLEQQLSARVNGQRALVEDRKALQQQLHTLQSTAQQQICILERQHRDAVRHLEEAHRRRTLAASRDAKDASMRHELCTKRGIARVVSELMAFLAALETHAASMPRNRDRCSSLSVNQTPDQKEDVLRAACDDIARNFLGLEGGWEALLPRSPSAQRDCGHHSNTHDSLIPAGVRRRVQRFLLDYLETHILARPEPSAGGVRAVLHNLGNKKALSVSFAVSGEKNKDDDDDEWYNEHRSGGEQPLVELLMECVQCVFS